MTDGWDRRLTYRVFPVLSLNEGMDMTKCDPAGTHGSPSVATCNSACVGTDMSLCTRPDYVLLNKGLKVRNIAGSLLMDPAVAPYGAAYVVISHGESGGGGYLSGGILGASTTTDGGAEMLNYANQVFDPSTTQYVDDAIVETGGAGHFDDLVSRPSVIGVISKAGLGPRAH
jgi:hypothetical protein